MKVSVSLLVTYVGCEKVKSVLTSEFFAFELMGYFLSRCNSEYCTQTIIVFLLIFNNPEKTEKIWKNFSIDIFMKFIRFHQTLIT
jgi:hypothetical protein